MRDPAFLFYVGDWMGGTVLFSRAQKGAYIDLLTAQFNNGRMSLEDIKDVLGSDYESMWERRLKSKFKQDESGLFYNERLEKEKNKRKDFAESRRKNRKSSENNDNSEDNNEHMSDHMNEDMTNHMCQHMENENRNRDIVKNELGKGGVGEKPKPRNSKSGRTSVFIPPTLDEAKEFFNLNGYTEAAAILAWEYYREGNWIDSKGSKVLNWKQKFRSVWFKPENKISNQNVIKLNPQHQASMSIIGKEVTEFTRQIAVEHNRKKKELEAQVLESIHTDP